MNLVTFSYNPLCIPKWVLRNNTKPVYFFLLFLFRFLSTLYQFLIKTADFICVEQLQHTPPTLSELNTIAVPLLQLEQNALYVRISLGGDGGRKFP